MFGGGRDKTSRLRTNLHGLAHLARRCSGQKSHEPRATDAHGRPLLHLPWPISLCRKGSAFATSEEAAYQAPLCAAIAKLCDNAHQPRFENRVLSIVKPGCARAAAPTKMRVTKAKAIAAAGRQPRGRAFARMVPEYKSVPTFELKFAAIKNWLRYSDLKLSSEVTLNGIVCPPGTRLLSLAAVEKRGGFAGSSNLPKGCRSVSTKRGLLDLAQNAWPDDTAVVATVGIPWSVREFTAQACAAPHPASTKTMVSDELAKAIFKNLTSTPAEVLARRRTLLAFWGARAEVLKAEDDKIIADAHPDVRAVIQGQCGTKRLLLGKELATAASYPHPEIFEGQAAGFPLVGSLPRNLAFPQAEPDEVQSVEWLEAQAGFAHAATEAKARATDPVMAKAVWDKTCEELEKGFLRGPLTAQQLTNKYGAKWIASPRFGVSQKDVVRCIDDFSVFWINICFAAYFKVDLGGVDEIAAILRTFLDAVRNDGSVVVHLSDGTVLRGQLPTGVSPAKARRLLGKCIDLKSAYRQLARDPAHAAFSLIAVYNSATDQTEFFELLAMAFGSRAAVYAFNAVARAFQYMLVSVFGVIAANYYDDYPLIEPAETAESAGSTAVQVFEMLGWEVKSETKQAKVSELFSALGVVFDLSSTAQGYASVRNKPERVIDLTAEIKDVLEKRQFRAAHCESLRGKLRYAAGQTFGRCGGLAFRLLGEHIEIRRPWSPEAEMALGWFLTFLANAAPRDVRPTPSFGHAVVFTDAACEDDGALVTAGAVIWLPHSRSFEFLYYRVPEFVTKSWRSSASGQVIGQAELHPVVIAKLTWAEALRKTLAVFFVDKDSARDALIRGYSPVLASCGIIAQSSAADAALGLCSWYERVPSPSNIGDGPSRGEFGPLLAIGARRVRPVLPDSWPTD